ncbi:MAG: hypothetical protein ACLFUL_00225 [Desulfobacteraceae bacterium]
MMFKERHSKHDLEGALTGQLVPWVENISSLVNAVMIALCFGLMGAFWFAKITPLFLLIFGFPVLCLILYWLFYKGGLMHNIQPITRRAWIYAMVLAVLISGGLYLRYPTSAHTHGGQDQGSYFNIAAWIANHGTYERHDKLLADAFSQKWPFAFNLIWNPYKSQGKPQEDIPGEYEGERFVGGFTVKDREKGEVVPQFYPLTALLLTTGQWMFGGKHTSDILPVFGILSVISAGLLAFRMFESTFVAILVFVTLLFCGLQVFFSTFPVSEIISQYFLLTGMWFVLRAMEEESCALPLLAGLNFTVAFFNHVSSIFYLAPVIVFFVFHRMASNGRTENRQMLIFYYVFLTGLVSSLISARVYNGYYVYRNLKENLTFFETLHIDGVFATVFAAVFIGAAVPLMFYACPGKWLETKANWIKWILLSGIFFITLITAVKFVLFKWGIISPEGRTYTYVASITAHISFIGWLVLLWGLVMAVLRDKIKWTLLPLLVLLWFSFLFLFLQFRTEYQWYFARYYVKEFYPLAIIFTAYGIFQFSQLRFLKNIPGKVVTAIFGLSLVLYSAHPNLYIFKKPFLDGAYEGMTALDSKMKEHGIILLVTGRDRFAPPDSELRLSVPLVYSFDHDVIWLPLKRNLAQMTQIVTGYLSRYKRPLYLLYVGTQPLPRNLFPPGSKYMASQLHEFSEPERAKSIPKQHWQIRMRVHLYEL